MRDVSNDIEMQAPLNSEEHPLRKGLDFLGMLIDAHRAVRMDRMSGNIKKEVLKPDKFKG
jgi:hypothetical protein